MPAFAVIILAGIIGSAFLAHFIEDRKAANAAAAISPYNEDGNAIAQGAAADFDPLIEATQQEATIGIQIGQGLPFNASQDPSTASLS